MKISTEVNVLPAQLAWMQGERICRRSATFARSQVRCFTISGQ